jgi:hypothetical protein
MKPLHQSLADDHQFKIYGFKTYRNTRDDFFKLKNTFSNYIQLKMEELGTKKISNFSLKNYHLHLAELDLDHHEFIKTIGRKVPEISLDMGYINKLIEIANNDLENEFQIYKSNIEFRVVRPTNQDNNELHRDHWFPYFTPLVNIYIPIQNSFYNSAMGVVPFSHEWSEEDVIPTFTYEESAAGKKYIKNGIHYSVPAVKSSTKELNLHRPDLTEGDFMLFSPKTVHGGGTNSSNGTRFSFEIRLEPLKHG